MARGNKIKFRSSGFKRVLSSAGTRRLVHDTAYRMASRAGEGVIVKERYGKFGGGRPIAHVHTTPKDAADSEKQRESLESAAHGM